MESENLIVEMIPTDFDVVRIGSYQTVTLFGAERKDLFHFVCYDEGSGLSQYNIPHYRIADAIGKAGEKPEERLTQPLTDGLSLVTQRNGPLGLITGEVCFLLNGSRSEPMAARMLGIAEMLQSAKKRVVSENGVYTVAGAKTHCGNPMSSEFRSLMEAIAFERSLLRRLSATKTFGVYSAFALIAISPVPWRENHASGKW